jgi:hypothetical protein
MGCPITFLSFVSYSIWFDSDRPRTRRTCEAQVMAEITRFGRRRSPTLGPPTAIGGPGLMGSVSTALNLAMPEARRVRRLLTPAFHASTYRQETKVDSTPQPGAGGAERSVPECASQTTALACHPTPGQPAPERRGLWTSYLCHSAPDSAYACNLGTECPTQPSVFVCMDRTDRPWVQSVGQKGSNNETNLLERSDTRSCLPTGRTLCF